MNIFVWDGECSRCGWTLVDEMDLYLAVGPNGITNAQMICKNAIFCQERQRDRPAR